MGEVAQMVNALRGGGGSTYPTSDDVAYSRRYDAAYGDPNSPFLEGNAKIATQQIDALPLLLRQQQSPTGPALPVDPETADSLYRGWMGSKRSAVSGLGFDPHRMVVSPNSDTELNVGGFYEPNTDVMWYNKQTTPSAVVHESFHRGLQKMQDAGVLPESVFKLNKSIPEEYMVRALMLKHFGDVEYAPDKDAGNKQVNEGRKYVSHPALDDLEKAAADYYAKQFPRGPR